MSEDSKKALRELFSQKYLANTNTDRSADLVALLGELEAIVRPRAGLSMACFFSHQHEPDLADWYQSLIKIGVRLAFPCFEPDRKEFGLKWILDYAHDFAPGEYGILAPKPELPRLSDAERLMTIDYWLVPGLLFDHFGVRLGRGKGIYDRLLSQVSGSKVAVAYHWQIVPHIPRDPWDIPMDYIATETCSFELMQR